MQWRERERVIKVRFILISVTVWGGGNCEGVVGCWFGAGCNKKKKVLCRVVLISVSAVAMKWVMMMMMMIQVRVGKPVNEEEEEEGKGEKVYAAKRER